MRGQACRGRPLWARVTHRRQAGRQQPPTEETNRCADHWPTGRCVGCRWRCGTASPTHSWASFWAQVRQPNPSSCCAGNKLPWFGGWQCAGSPLSTKRCGSVRDGPPLGTLSLGTCSCATIPRSAAPAAQLAHHASTCQGSATVDLQAPAAQATPVFSEAAGQPSRLPASDHSPSPSSRPF